jgi:hypothetical protein
VSVLDLLTGSLPPTATYQRRDWVWLPASEGDYADGRLGTLTIVLQHSRRAGAKQESDSYGVDFESEPVAGRGTNFLLVNDTDAGQPDAYRVRIGPEVSCTCKAGKCRVPCKHIDAILDVIEQGGIVLPQ